MTELASGLATMHGAEIFVLLHIMPITPIDMEREAEERTSAAADQLNALREDQLPARARLLQEWADLVDAHGRVQTVLRVGEPSRQIIAAAEGTDLIVIYLHAQGSIRGSAAWQRRRTRHSIGSVPDAHASPRPA